METKDPQLNVSSYPDHLRELVDSWLNDLRFPARAAEVTGLEEAMRYSLLAGGKRIRPVLVLASAHACGLAEEQAKGLALALEMIHTYSLIHDDLPAMDDDDLRRGEPTCHVKYGEDVAILAGDALYAEAFRLLLAQRHLLEPTRLLESCELLASASGVDGMVGGQFLDVADKAKSSDQLEQLHQLKTGRLIQSSVECAAVLAGVSNEQRNLLSNYASEIGLLFQIIDDILDVVGTDSQLGKPQGSDAKHGKLTYVTEFGLDGAQTRSQQHFANALVALEELERCSGDPMSSQGIDELRGIAEFIFKRSN